ncbi:protein tyrosine phosphatase [Polaromonas sp. YR568]|uniref:arsenate reductase/protein-tyrosine-phosphatase family protein n=1 Tax=Polaromonas sp. YR568 TaxID=1855301 RepID=UPI00398BDF0B
MARSSIHVLFVSCANRARSILAEACLNQLGKGRFHAFSCGARGHTGGPIPEPVLEVLETASVATTGLHSKSWNEFTRLGTPRMDFVISLDEATASQHPSWPGQPDTALWGSPAILLPGIDSSELKAMSLQTLYSLRRRLELLVALPMHGSDRAALRSDIRDMAHMA